MFPLIAVKRNPELNSSVFCEIKKNNSVLFVAVFFGSEQAEAGACGGILARGRRERRGASGFKAAAELH